MMKRVCIVILLCCFICSSTAYADFTVGTMNYLKMQFEENNRPMSWVNSSSTSRALLWGSVYSDIINYDKDYEPKQDKETPVVIMGIAETFHTMHFYTTIYMYTKDSHGLYRQVVICPERDYLIYENTGIPYKKAKENLLSNTISCYEMNYDELMYEINLINSTKSSNNTTSPTSSPTAMPSPNINEDDSRSKAMLPLIHGPYSGKKIEVIIHGKKYVLHQDFKAVMDQYQKFFDTYIDLLLSLNKNDPDYATKYFDLMNQYVDVSLALEKLDNTEELTEDESMYCIYIMNDVNARLLKAMQK